MCVIARSRWAKVRTSQLNWAGPRRAEPNNYPAIRRIAVTPGVCPVTGAWRTVSASQRLIRFLCFSHTAWTHWPLGTHVFDCRHTPLRIIWALLDFYCTPRSKSPENDKKPDEEEEEIEIKIPQSAVLMESINNLTFMHMNGLTSKTSFEDVTRAVQTHVSTNKIQKPIKSYFKSK